MLMSVRKGQLSATCAAAALLAVMAHAPSASAQAQSGQAQTPPAEAADEVEAPAETVVVVGSRIRRDTFNSASPIQVVTREETTLAGLASTTAVLQSSSVTSGAAQINDAFGGFVTNGGPGANTVGLRGLGPGRSLVLINGRRVAPAGSRGSVGSADLNVLPNALINRIEVLRDGASAIYGSDAIGGVINIVTRKVDGIAVELQHNRPVESGGDRTRASVVGGRSFGSLNLQGSLEYYKSNELTLGERDWTRCQTDGRFSDTTGLTVDFIDPATGRSKCYPITGTGSNGVTINTLGTPGFTGVGAAGSVGTSFNRWRPNSAVTTGLVGFEGVGGGANNLNVRDTFDPDMWNNSLLSPVEIWTGFGTATYDVGPVQFYSEVLVNRRSSSQTGYRQLTLDYATGSPLLPANIAAVPGNFLGAGGSVLSPNPIKARAFIGFGNSLSYQEVDFFKVLGGVRGELPFLSDWEYDFNVQHSKSDALYVFPSWLTDRLAASLDVAAPVAGVPTNLIRGGLTCAINNVNPAAANCVPAPFLNAATIGGDLPEDWKRYTFVDVPATTEYEETTVTFSTNGKLLTLPAGDLEMAFGMEFRDASINDQPNANSVSGNLYNLTSSAPTVGSDSVWEAFGELQIPILADMPGAQRLTVEIAGRYTDYDSYGSDTTYKAGILYKPTEFLTFRVSQGTSYRAPALFEQFLGATSGFVPNSNDPCNNYTAPGVNPNRAANCAALNLPANWDVGAGGNNQSIRVFQAGGAAQGLEAETSDNLTVGAILETTFWNREIFGTLAIAVDYFDIVINNGVSRAGTGFLLSECYDSPNFSSPFCAYSERAPVTNALTVYDSFTNIASQTAMGYDFNIRWDRRFGDVAVVVNASVTRFKEQTFQARPNAAVRDSNGELNNPELTGSIDANFTWKRWRVRYGVEWVSDMESYTINGLNPATTPFDLDVPDYYLHNASLRYTGEDWGFTLGVRNIADETPPEISYGVTNRVGNSPLYSGYDYRGREVFMNVSRSF